MRRFCWIILLAGCREERERDFVLTPQGYSVEFAGYGGEPVAPIEEIYAEFDKAVVKAAGELYRYGVDQTTTESIAHGTGFVLIDAIRFQVPDGRWATGANFGKEIWVAMHRRISGTEFHANALPWTCFIHSSGEYRYGIYTPGDCFPALGHEIGHTIFGPAFEHTYFPPVVNP